MQSISIHKAINIELWSLSINDVALLTSIVFDSNLLLLIEVIELDIKRILQVLYSTIRVQSLPGFPTNITLTALEHKQ